MRPTQYSLEKTKGVFRREKVLTIESLQKELGSPSRATLFRKLEQAGCISSYSHRGKYYTLRSIPRFNRNGLWTWQQIGFSRHGNLLKTVEAIVTESKAGYMARELTALLNVDTLHCVKQIVQRDDLIREKFSGEYIYFSIKPEKANIQRQARQERQAQKVVWAVSNPELAVQEAKAVLLLFVALLDERQRRIYAGLESLRLGHGGDAHIAGLLNMDPATVARGRQELLDNEVQHERLRSEGAGRNSLVKKTPKS